MDRKTKNPGPAFLLLQWGERVQGKAGEIPECLCNHYMFVGNCSDLDPNLQSTLRRECSVIIWVVFLAKVTEKKIKLPEKVKERKRMVGHVEMSGG